MRFEITVKPSTFSQITVILATIFMKLRIIVSVMDLKYRISSKICLDHRITASEIVNYRTP